jgi:cullin 3
MRMPGSGLLSMIDDDRMSDLARLYTLFGRPGVTEGLEALKRDLKLEIRRRGNAINLATMESDSRPEGNSEQKAVTEPDASGPKKSGLTGAAAIAAALRWVQEVVDLKDRFDRILKEAFAEDKGIQVAMNEVS